MSGKTHYTFLGSFDEKCFFRQNINIVSLNNRAHLYCHETADIFLETSPP